MIHRHLNHQDYSLAAIDDIIARGHRKDWEDFRLALIATPALAAKVRQICEPRLVDPYAQRYHFWMHYVKERFA